MRKQIIQQLLITICTEIASPIARRFGEKIADKIIKPEPTKDNDG